MPILFRLILKVARVIRETDDTSSLVLSVPEALRDAFAYRPGQFLTFEVPFDGAKLYRCYSLASSPDVDAEHQRDVGDLEPALREVGLQDREHRRGPRRPPRLPPLHE